MDNDALGLPIGTVLQNIYVIEGVQGRGGFGRTYRAYDRMNNIRCAVKEYFPNRISMRDAMHNVIPVSQDKLGEFEYGRQRFIEEADTLRKLHGYKNIVNITDYFNENNTSYFVMEYIDGMTLNQLRKAYGGRIPLKEAWEILYHVCTILDALHTKKELLHRDISPENIMIDRNRNVKLIDFGNARDIGIRKGYTVVLKRGYAPFEQYSRNGVQGSYTDVYALAATFYFLMTGVMIPDAPERLSGETYLPLSQLVPAVPVYVSNAFDMALRIKTTERTQTVRMFMNQIFGTPDVGTASASTSTSGNVSGKPYVDVVSGQNMGKRYYLPVNKQVTMGRSRQDADVCLSDDLRMSKRHCYVSYDAANRCFYITDCSTNGIYINDVPLKKNSAEMIRDERLITFGNHICEIKFGISYE